MKKYITPDVEVLNTETTQMMALSILTDDADDSTVLSREDAEWDIWSDND